MRGPDTSTLVGAARAGDEAAWTELVRRFDGAVRSATRGFRLERADAEDVAQTTWLRLLEQGVELRNPEALAGWLSTTARRECMRVKTARLREVPLPPGDLPDAPLPDHGHDRLVAEQRRDAVRGALASLTPRQRGVLTLLIDEPAPSYDHVAARLGVPVGSVGPTRLRAVRQLRRHGALRALESDGAAA